MKPGDVFAVSLPDGRYGAVRVIRQVDKSSLVYTSTYLEQNAPDIEEPKLLEILEQHRFQFKGQPAIKWLDGQPPKPALHIGNIPPSEQETRIVCQVYGGKWSESTGAEVFWEWRWKYDREAYEEEIKQKDREREQLRRKPQKPKRMMAEETFWKIIELLDWRFEGNDSKVIAPAIQELADMSSVAICEFAETLAFKLYKLDTKKHALNAGPYVYNENDDYVSADGFLYARCVVVANDKQYYDEVLKDPTRMPKDLEFEALLSIAPKAYELKTGEDFEYTTGCSFETFSNVEGWQ
jgi:hypothetical protein